MTLEWSAALESVAFVRALRDSVWMYPLVNAGHILGVSLLVGAIVPLDLRLMGMMRAVPLPPLWRVLSAAAAVGLLLAAVFGLLLFSTRASEYLRSTFFLGKFGTIALGLLNAVMLRWTLPPHLLSGATATPAIPMRVRVAAAVSLLAWLATLTLGRLVGYF